MALKGCLKIAFRIFTILSLYYLSLTAPNQRTYDVFEGGGHADYIKYVAEKGELPKIGTGWEYHQPPVYYLLAAGIYRLIGISGEALPWEVFQVMNWLLFQLFIAVGLKTLGENLFGRELIPASFLFALWPMNLAHSVRIGNDNLIYVLCGAAIMFFLRWCKSFKPSDLLCASGFTAIACFTKSTALPLVAAISFIACIQLIAAIAPKIQSIIRPWLAETLSGARLKGAIAVVGGLLTVAVLSLFPKLLNPEIHNAEAFLFPGVTSHPNLRIAIGSSTFLPFASLVGAFKPFVSPWVDASGRSNFWIYLFKSAQTGELFSAHSTLSFLAYLYLFSSYVFLALILYGVLILLIKAKQKVLPCLLLIAAAVAGLIVSTLAQPNACNQDFRYVYYLLIPLIILAMAGLGNLSYRFLRVVCMLPIILIIVAGNFLILGIARNF